MNPEIKTALHEWKATFQDELSALLAGLNHDRDIYGFALNLPEDLADPDLAVAVGRRSKLTGSRLNVLAHLTQKYSPVEWDSLPNAVSFQKTGAELEEISRTHRDAFIAPSSEYTGEGLEYRDSLYAACVDVMEQCDAAGSFGPISFKAVYLSDGHHPIVDEALRRLNPNRSAVWRWTVRRVMT